LNAQAGFACRYRDNDARRAGGTLRPEGICDKPGLGPVSLRHLMDAGKTQPETAARTGQKIPQET
jgi:hypothetical protein